MKCTIHVGRPAGECQVLWPLGTSRKVWFEMVVLATAALLRIVTRIPSPNFFAKTALYEFLLQSWGCPDWRPYIWRDSEQKGNQLTSQSRGCWPPKPKVVIKKNSKNMPSDPQSKDTKICRRYLNNREKSSRRRGDSGCGMRLNKSPWKVKTKLDFNSITNLTSTMEQDVCIK